MPRVKRVSSENGAVAHAMQEQTEISHAVQVVQPTTNTRRVVRKSGDTSKNAELKETKQTNSAKKTMTQSKKTSEADSKKKVAQHQDLFTSANDRTEAQNATIEPKKRTRTKRAAQTAATAVTAVQFQPANAAPLFEAPSISDDTNKAEKNADIESLNNFVTTRKSSTKNPKKSTENTAKPITSILFQAPVLPEVTEEDEEVQSSKSKKVQREKTVANKSSAEKLKQNKQRDKNRNERQSDKDEAKFDNNFDDFEEIEEVKTRHRRLNAKERAAAAEVEQIEEDLESENIVYTPIDEFEDMEQVRRRRRRRKNEDSLDEDFDERQEDESSDDEDESTTTITRRRRRRRRGNDDKENEELTIPRSRKQQYIDEITDIEGSTRLEAKKQRRRDNRRERNRQSQIMEQDFLALRENVNRQMVVRERGQHTQISVIEDDVLVEHYVSDIQEVSTVGNIYLGRIQNVLPSMEAAFVDIGQLRNGVLYAGEVNWDTTRLDGKPRRIEHAFKSGDPVLVQVTKDPIGHKGARLTAQVTLAGRFLVLVPSGGMTGVSRKLSDKERNRLKNIVAKVAPENMGVIIRTAAEGASEEAITHDLERLTKQWEKITAKKEEFLHGKRAKLLQGQPDVAIRVVRDIFNDDFSTMMVEGEAVYERITDYLDNMAPELREKVVRWDPEEHNGKDVFDKWQIDSQLRKGMERQVYLPSGGSIVIDRTEAMTTIDVNTGRFIGQGKSLEETVTHCNLEAAEEIARQLRLRDIGGMVMIDFVDMVMQANRDLVLRRLVECLARDRTKHQVAEVTSLGLVQMTRKRIGQGLVEAFSEECSACGGRGFIVHDEPTVSAKYADPYALKGGDPFVKTNKHRNAPEVQAPQGSSSEVKAKLAQIAAAAVTTSEDVMEKEVDKILQHDTKKGTKKKKSKTSQQQTQVESDLKIEQSQQDNESKPTQDPMADIIEVAAALDNQNIQDASGEDDEKSAVASNSNFDEVTVVKRVRRRTHAGTQEEVETSKIRRTRRNASKSDNIQLNNAEKPQLIQDDEKLEDLGLSSFDINNVSSSNKKTQNADENSSEIRVENNVTDEADSNQPVAESVKSELISKENSDTEDTTVAEAEADKVDHDARSRKQPVRRRSAVRKKLAAQSARKRTRRTRK